jgi:L-threonylcarbamoyladenylate synthase
MAIIIDYNKESKKALKTAIHFLNSNKPIVFQTDTVFGFLAQIENKVAKNQIISLKQRDGNKPFQILVSSKKQAFEIGNFNILAKKIANKYWPGSLTVIIKANPLFKKQFNYELETVGIRYSNFAPINSLIRNYKKPIFATSVNISGEKELSTTEEIEQKFGRKVPLIIFDSSKTLENMASTVVDLINENEMKIIRQGALKINI